MSDSSKQRMDAAIGLMKRGGTLLKETCPRCGGLQVKHMDRKLCVNCSDLTAINTAEVSTVADIAPELRELVVRKLKEAMGLLEKESSVEKQTQIATLLVQYLELAQLVDDSLKRKQDQK